MKEGETEAKLYEEFTDFCNDESKETQFEIKTGKGASERASATIADETAKIGAAEAKIDELSTTIATNEKDLGAATEIREKAPAISLEKISVAAMRERLSVLNRHLLSVQHSEV